MFTGCSYEINGYKYTKLYPDNILSDKIKDNVTCGLGVNTVHELSFNVYVYIPESKKYTRSTERMLGRLYFKIQKISGNNNIQRILNFDFSVCNLVHYIPRRHYLYKYLCDIVYFLMNNIDQSTRYFTVDLSDQKLKLIIDEKDLYDNKNCELHKGDL